MFPRLLRFMAMLGALAMSGSAGTHPIFCDRFEEESCLELPRITLELPALETFESGELLINLETGALADGEEVLLLSSDPEILEVPNSIIFSQSQSEMAIPVTTAAAFGTVTIEASSTNYQPDVIEATVAPRGLEFRLGPLIGVGQTFEGEIELNRGAPEGGTTIQFSTSNASVVAISPLQVTIPGGEQTAPVTISGLEPGSVELSASAPGYVNDTLAVSSSHEVVSIGNIPDLVPGERRSLPISLTQPAPAGGLTILLDSADPAIATVDAFVEIPEGSRVPSANTQVTGIATGSTVVTASMDGFASVSRTVAVTKFQLSFSADPFELPVGWTTSVTATLSKSAPAGGLEITLTNQDDSIATAPDSITIPAGQTSASIEIIGLNSGSTSLLAQANNTDDASIEIHVGELPAITLDDFVVGKDLQDAHFASLTRSPQQPVDLILTVADPAVALLTLDNTLLGTASISFSNVRVTSDRYFHIQGLSRGTTTITASAAGFNDVQATITVTDSGFYIRSPSSISTTTLSVPSYVNIGSAQLNIDGSWSDDQGRRAGLTVQVPVTSANPGVGQINVSPLVFEGGTGGSMATRFVPNAIGNTTVSMAQPAGFTAPIDCNQSIDAKVGNPYNIDDLTVGEGLQSSHNVLVGYPFSLDTDVTVTVANPAIAVLSPDRTTAGTDSITLNNTELSFDWPFYVQGISQGTTAITASAAGFNDVLATITVAESGFYIGWPGSISTTTVSIPTDIGIRSTLLNADGSRVRDQEIRAGLTVEVPVTSADPGIGQIVTNPAVLAGGTGTFVTTQFDPNAVGTTTISVIQPAGFNAPTDGVQSIDAEVRTPDIDLDSFSVGKDLQGQHRIRLDAQPAEPVDLFVSVIDPTIAVLSRSPVAMGTTSITLSGVSSDNFSTFYVQGLSKGTTTITASAAGFIDVRADLTVTDSGFYINSASPISTTTLSDPRNITLSAARIDATGSWKINQRVRPGLTVEVPVANSHPGVGQITVSPVVFEGGTGADKTIQFVPNTAGTTTVSMTQPAGFVTPSDRNQAIDVKVGAPFISLYDFSVGKDLQDSHRVNLIQSPPDPVDLVLNVADPAIAVISSDRAIAGTSSITLAAVTNTTNQWFYVQGLSKGTTTLTASAAGFNDVQVTLTVTNSGFNISGPSPISTTTFSSPTHISIKANQLYDLSPMRPQEVRAGLTVQVPVTTADSTVGQITVNPVVFEGGTGSSKSTQFDPNAVGTTTVNMSQPAGFTVPIYHDQSLEVEVSAPFIALDNFEVGKDLQGKHHVNLGVSPPEPVDLVITVADPSISVISTQRTVMGTTSIIFSSVSDTSDQNFYVQGLSQGSTTITVSATGFVPAQAILTVSDSGFFIAEPVSISTSHYSNPTNMKIMAGPVGANGVSSIAQEIRAGLTIELPVSSANSAVGQITSSPVVFEGGTGSTRTTQFVPMTRGITNVSMVQPAGFTSPINRNQSINAEVSASDIVFDDASVGDNLQRWHRVELSSPPPDPVDVVITVADPTIALISHQRTVVGSPAITLDSVSSTDPQSFYVQGLSQGSTTITASAAGYNDIDATLSVTDSGFYIRWPSSILTTTLSSPTSIAVQAVQLDTNGWTSSELEVRAGLTVEVPVASANPNVGQVSSSTVVFEGGTGSAQTTHFTPVMAGTTTVGIAQPTGFTAPVNREQAINAEVRTPGISLSDSTVGENLQDRHGVSLSVPPSTPVDLVLTVADPAIAVVSRSPTTAGSASIILSDLSSTSGEDFWIQGLNQGTTTVTASATDFSNSEATLTVTDSGFQLSPSSISTTTYSSPTNISIRSLQLSTDGSWPDNQEVRAGLTVEVPVTIANADVGQLSVSPLVFEGGTDSSMTTQFIPNTVGTTTVNMTQPAGFTTPTYLNEVIDVEVRTPEITLNSFTVGENLQDRHRVSLAQSPPNPVDLVLTVDNPSIALIAANSTTVGTASLTFNAVGNTIYRYFRVQGLSEGSTTIRASAPGFNDVEAVLTVTGSGFYIESPSLISTTTLSNPTNIRIRSARLNATGTNSDFQEVRAGLTVEVPVASADPNVGQITTSPVIFEGGGGTYKTTQFDPNTAGTTIISMTQPSGFTAPTNRNQSINAQVID